MKRALAYLAIIIAITGCIYPFEVTLPQQDSPSIVVDANIKIGAFSEVALRYVQPLDNFSSGSTFPAGSVYIESESGEKYTTKGDNGVFSIDTRMASVSKKYRIVVNADGETIVSDWCTPLPPPIVSDVRIWADELAVFVSADIDASEGSTGYIAVSFYELWRFHADYIRQYGYDPIDKIIYSLMEYDLSHYWCWKTNMPKEEVFLDLNLSGGKVGDLVVTRFGRSNSRNHDDYTVTVLARNVSESEYRFRSLMRENVSNGGNLFTPDPGEIPGNLICETNPDKRVYGYVNAYVYGSNKQHIGYQFYILSSPASLTIPNPENYNTYYWQGYLPIDMTPEGEIGWGKASCYDCVEAGGTLDIPEVTL